MCIACACVARQTHVLTCHIANAFVKALSPGGARKNPHTWVARACPASPQTSNLPHASVIQICLGPSRMQELMSIPSPVVHSLFLSTPEHGVCVAQAGLGPCRPECGCLSPKHALVVSYLNMGCVSPEHALVLPDLKPDCVSSRHALVSSYLNTGCVSPKHALVLPDLVVTVSIYLSDIPTCLARLISAHGVCGQACLG